MSTRKDDFALVRGSGNVFADLGHPDAQREQVRALLAAKIIQALDKKQLSLVAAEELTGFSATEFSRIRRVKLERFTIDRLMTILGKLEPDLEVSMTFRARSRRIGQHHLPAIQ